MLKKHIPGFILLALAFGAGYLLIDIYGQAGLTAAQLLLIGLILGFAIGIAGPGIFIKIQSRPRSQSTDQNTTLYVGNLPFRTTRYELRELFQPYGKIHSARIVIDRATRKPRGYGFVEMDDKGARKAITSLNGHTLAGRNLKVSEANERA